jgi:hypothetical protein
VAHFLLRRNWSEFCYPLVKDSSVGLHELKFFSHLSEVSGVMLLQWHLGVE